MEQEEGFYVINSPESIVPSMVIVVRKDGSRVCALADRYTMLCSSDPTCRLRFPRLRGRGCRIGRLEREL